MIINRISVYQLDLPIKEGSFHWAGGKSVSVCDSTIVCIETDAELKGWGEVCPLGPFYLPAFGQGVRAGLYEIGSALLGASPLELNKLNRNMDIALKGHSYVKSAVDMACWDIFGKHTGLPVCELMGGRFGKDFALHRVISLQSPEEMAIDVAKHRDEGYRRFKLKVGANNWHEDVARIRQVADQLEQGDVLVADANTGWQSHEALQICKQVADLDLCIEQPCASYEACQIVRQHWSGPMILDETIDSLDSLIRGQRDRAMDMVNIEISKFGGLTKAKQIRDLAVDLNLVMTIEDSWGGDITTAAMAHLAQSTVPEFLMSSMDFNSYGTIPYAKGAPLRDKGRLACPTQPGLGIEPDLDVLGDPMFVIE